MCQEVYRRGHGRSIVYRRAPRALSAPAASAPHDRPIRTRRVRGLWARHPVRPRHTINHGVMWYMKVPSPIPAISVVQSGAHIRPPTPGDAWSSEVGDHKASGGRTSSRRPAPPAGAASILPGPGLPRAPARIQFVVGPNLLSAAGARRGWR